MEPVYIKPHKIKTHLTRYLDKSLLLLDTGSFPDEKTIHKVRVLLKKTRALFRLVSPLLGEEFAGNGRKSLRTAGRIMSPWREKTVLWKTAGSLMKAHPDVFYSLEDNERIKNLMNSQVVEQDLTEDIMVSLKEVIRLLKETSSGILFEPMISLEPVHLFKELENSYAIAVHNYLLARNDQGLSIVHEFRKRSKDFLYQLSFFRQANPTVIIKLEKKLERMTGDLGKYNDLSVLLRMTGYKYKRNTNDPALDELAVIIKDKQDEYLSKVWPVAYEIFGPLMKLDNVLADDRTGN